MADSIPPNDEHDPEANGEQLPNGITSQDTVVDIVMADQPSTAPNGAARAPPGDARIPAKKDASLREFLSKMDEHAPIVRSPDSPVLLEADRRKIPDAVTNYYLTLAGLPPPPATPLPLARLLALAAQKFIADVAADAYQYSRIRASNTSGLGLAPGQPAGGDAARPAALGGKEGGAAAAAAAAAAVERDKGKNAHMGMQRPGFGAGGHNTPQGRTVLTMEDLGMAVGEYGVNVKRGEFYR
jgi:transcription initiation factor TFIID subunit 10